MAYHLIRSEDCSGSIEVLMQLEKVAWFRSIFMHTSGFTIVRFEL